MAHRLDSILNEVCTIREQHNRAGELLRPRGTGTPGQMMALNMAQGVAAIESLGERSWGSMLSVRSARALASTGEHLRTELLEIAALAVAFVENIDRVDEIEARDV